MSDEQQHHQQQQQNDKPIKPVAPSTELKREGFDGHIEYDKVIKKDD